MKNLVFKELDLSIEVQKAISEMGFEEATPIQSESIPHIMAKRDIIGQAQTGTGKTCAFGIPAIEMIDMEDESIQVLVLCPTRELSIQSTEELKEVAKYKEGIRILPIYGGQPIDRQIMALKKHPKIIIGTPGRIMDHLRRKTLKLQNLRMIVLDEADEMLNMGFREDIDIILEKTPSEKQTILFSATMPKEILDLTSKYQNNPLHIKVSHKQLTVPSIEQYYLEVSNSNRLEVLSRIIDTSNIKLSLVFCNTKKKVDELANSLQSRGYATEALHGDLRQEQRDKVMAQFRKGSLDILIATDVAARGIDVDDVEAVFNFDIPNDEEYYVHRIGRTGRAGRSGKAYTFVSGREIYKLRDIQKYTKSVVHPMKPPTLSDVEEHRMNNLLNLLKKTVSDGHLSKYAKFIEKALDDINGNQNNEAPEENDADFLTTLDLAAALLKLLANDASNSSNTLPEIDNQSFGSDNEMVRLFMNVGRKDKIEPQHILKSIASSSGIEGRLIGSIDIYDIYTFVEVPRKYANEVLESMKNHTIKGKKVSIEKSKPKSDKKDQPKPRRNSRPKTKPTR